MFLNARNNQFSFNFPKAFIPDEINERYTKYLNSNPGALIKKPIDLINYSIQSVNFPDTSYDPVSQIGVRGLRYYRDAKVPQDIYSKELTVTMKLMDGFINYWIMLDTFGHWYSFKEKKLHLPEGTVLRILNAVGQVIVTAEMQRLLYNSIGSLEMSFANNSPDFSTFDCGFTYNELFTKVELD